MWRLTHAPDVTLIIMNSCKNIINMILTVTVIHWLGEIRSHHIVYVNNLWSLCISQDALACRLCDNGYHFNNDDYHYHNREVHKRMY